MNVFEVFATLKLDTSGYEKGLNDAEKETQSLSSSLGDMGKGIAKAGAGVGVAGGALFAFANKSADAADEIDKMSQKLGLSAEGYQEWDYVMQLCGTDINSMTAGMKTMVNKFEDAKGGSEEAAAMFEQLGLSMEDIQDMSQEELFDTVITQLQGMEDSTERAALANDLLGKSATELRPLLNQTAEATAEQKQALHDMGGVMSDEAVKNGAAFKDSLTSLKTAFAGAANSLLEELIPAIKKLMDKVTKFVADGGLKKMLKTIKALSPAIMAVVSAIAAYKTAMGISKVIDAFRKASEGATVAQKLLNLAMNSNPFVLVATAVAAVTAALVTLFATNEDFRNAVLAIWESIKAGFENVVNAIKGIITGWIELIKNIPEIFKFVWDKIKTGIKAYWEAIGNLLSSIWDGITDTVKNIFQGIADFISGIWNGIKTTAENIWQTITGAITGAIEGVGQIIEDFWSGLEDLWTNITGWIGDVIDAFVGMIQKAFQWGAELAQNFWEGVESGAHKLEDVILGRKHVTTAVQMDESRSTSNFASRLNRSTATANAAGAGGDVVIPVYVGGEKIDEAVVTNEQVRNYRSGGM